MRGSCFNAKVIGSHGARRHDLEASSFLARAGVLAIWLLAGCSVYDASLIPQAAAGSAGTDSGNAAGNSASDAGGTAAGDSNAGGTRTSTAGDGSGNNGTTDNSSAVAGSDSGASGGSGGSGSVVEGGAPGTAGESGTAGEAEAGAPPTTDPTPIELAQGKSALASTTQTNNDAFKGNDADLTTRWCAANGNFPQWWRVDLGAAHELKSFAIRLEYPQRLHSFYVETSPDDVSYTTAAGATFTDVVGEVQSADFPAGTSARYVRVTVTNGAPDPDNQPHFTWASFFEFSVLGL